MQEPIYKGPPILRKQTPFQVNPKLIPAALSFRAAYFNIKGFLPPQGITVSIKSFMAERTRPENKSLRCFLMDYVPWRFSEPEKIEISPLDSVAYTEASAEEKFQARTKCALLTFTDKLNMKNGSKLRENHEYGILGSTLVHTTPYVLALLAYADWFEDPRREMILSMLSENILEAKPGWCGSFGPNGFILDLFDHKDACYDFNQMCLLAIVYSYYNNISAEAREWIINVLLANGRVERPGLSGYLTCGRVPNDWARAAMLRVTVPVIDIPVSPNLKRIGETENHIFMIAVARYLTNQLLYQRTSKPEFDNRRNGGDDYPSCMMQVLGLLRNFFVGGFSEYNSKPYSRYIRPSLLNLYNYAYDQEVRLAARLVLDYWTAYLAVSSVDLRRLVPFRRRNEPGQKTNQFLDGAMDNDLVNETLGADPMVGRLALSSGNLEAVREPGQREFATMKWLSFEILELLTNYRIPEPINDLFVNKKNRRFFQRLHRTPIQPVEVTGINCDNYEIYAGSPSYLISAGGRPSLYAIDPYIPVINEPSPNQEQQLGVAVPTTFIPAMGAGSIEARHTRDIIQFGIFSDQVRDVVNYGVAPDFACGYSGHMPAWLDEQPADGKFAITDRSAPEGNPGFILGIYKKGDYHLMEVLDSQLYPHVKKNEFEAHVNSQKDALNLISGITNTYRTFNGNSIQFVIWNNNELEGAQKGAKVLHISYSAVDTHLSLREAGNEDGRFLQGNILNTREQVLTVFNNPALRQSMVFDFRDPLRPSRISEKGEIEKAGDNHEVWVDFEWSGQQEGDFFRPFNNIAAAIANVAEGGTVKIQHGSTRERFRTNGKRCRLVASMGEVRMGS